MMENLLDKLSSYNLLNNLLPGVLFLVLIDVLEIVDIDESNLYLMLFGGYFMGMVLSRIGSLLVESLLKRWKIVKYVSFEDFVKAEANDTKISTLLSENNMFRTFIALFLLLLLLFCLCLIPAVKNWLSTPYAIIVILILLLLLFVLSYRKQTKYINNRIAKSASK